MESVQQLQHSPFSVCHTRKGRFFQILTPTTSQLPSLVPILHIQVQCCEVIPYAPTDSLIAIVQ